MLRLCPRKRPALELWEVSTRNFLKKSITTLSNDNAMAKIIATDF